MQPRRRLFLRGSLALALLIAALATAGSPSLAQDPPLAGLPAAGAAAAPVVVGGEALHAPDLVRRFYAGRGFRAAWAGRAGARRLDQLVPAIDHAGDQGLDPADYHRRALARSIESEDADVTDLLATDAFLSLASDIRDGKLDPATFERAWPRPPHDGDLVALLEKASESGRIGEALAALEPEAPDYRILKQALALYRKAAAAGGWTPIPDGPDLALGDEGPRVAALRRRLAATGLLPPGEEEIAVFDSQTQAALAAFQRRAGLEPTGIAGPQTLRELNRAPEERIATIRANLERWRWTPENLGRRNIRINIAEFRLEARENGRVAQTHDVIVGRPSRETPVFSDEMTFVIFNPWWETPPNIARLDELPLFQRDPGAVKRLGFDVYSPAGEKLDPDEIDWKSYSENNFPFRLRQQPGPLNALGRVKLMFPNPYNVYLHDTPAQQLFQNQERAFSSGCIRVRDALVLAEWALKETPGFGPAEIAEIVASGQERRVDLTQPIPVHILYFTVVSDPDGSFRFVRDIYNRDPALVAALDAPLQRQGLSETE